MAHLVVDSPARVHLVDASPLEMELARAFLTYHDRGIDFLIAQHKQKRFWNTQERGGSQQRQAAAGKLKPSIDSRPCVAREGAWEPLSASHIFMVPNEAPQSAAASRRLAGTFPPCVRLQRRLPAIDHSPSDDAGCLDSSRMG